MEDTNLDLSKLFTEGLEERDASCSTPTAWGDTESATYWVNGSRAIPLLTFTNVNTELKVGANPEKVGPALEVEGTTPEKEGPNSEKLKGRAEP